MFARIGATQEASNSPDDDEIPALSDDDDDDDDHVVVVFKKKIKIPDKPFIFKTSEEIPCEQFWESTLKEPEKKSKRWNFGKNRETTLSGTQYLQKHRLGSSFFQIATKVKTTSESPQGDQIRVKIKKKPSKQSKKLLQTSEMSINLPEPERGPILVLPNKKSSDRRMVEYF